MNSTQNLLERVRAQLDRKSDYAVAKAVGISFSRMSKYMGGTRQIDGDDVLCNIAQFLGDDPALLIATFHREKAGSANERAAWQRLETLAKRASTKIAAATLKAA